MTDSRDPTRWLRRGTALAIVVIGWVFIAWQNHFHVTAPMAFVCLGYLAVVATVYNLWRTGVAMADSAEDERDSTWAKPAGALGELEREKRTLIKAIKEAEFDHQMGKLSQRDADDMIRAYRGRAIEVIKEIDRLGLGAAETAREQILREVRARVQLEGKSFKKAETEARASAKVEGTKRGARPAKAARPAEDAGRPEPSGAAEAAAASAEAVASAAERAVPAPGAPRDHNGSPVEAMPAEQAAPARAAVQVPSDDELDADSTTAIEPRREDAAKEATP